MYNVHYMPVIFRLEIGLRTNKVRDEFLAGD